MNALILRYGWETKTIHIIFSYLFTSQTNAMKCGQTLAYGFFKAPEDIFWGVPPTLDDIKR